MQRFTWLLLLCWLLLGTCIQTQAQTAPVPSLMNFQGRLTKPDGTPVPDGTYSVRFSLWSATTGGTEKWNQTLNTIVVRNGTFAALLSGFPGGTFNSNLWLELQVGTDAPLTPRQQLVSVAYAMKADSVKEGAITSASIADGTITGNDIADFSISANKLVGGHVPPGGTAGGDLTGTYPNPELANKYTSLAKVSNNAMKVTLPAGSLDQQQPGAGDLNYSPGWQSFTPAISGYLTRLEIQGGTFANFPQPATLTLYAGEGGNGQVLSSQSMSFTRDINAFQVCNFSVPVYLEAGTTYTWRLSNYNNIAVWYAPGIYSRGRNDVSASQDYTFRTYIARQNISINTNSSAGLLNLPIVGLGRLGLVIGEASNIGAGNHSQFVIAQPANISYWPFSITRGGSNVFTIRENGSVNIAGANGPGLLNLPYVGPGKQGILLGSPSDVGAGQHAELMIAQPANAGGHWPFNIVRGGVSVYGVRENGSVFSASSRRYKEHITPLPDVLNRVLQLQGVTFDWKPEFGGSHDLGLIAEDFGAIFPELVEWSADGKEARGVRYDRIGVLAVEAIKQQQQKINALEARLKQYEQQQAQIEELRRRLDALQTAQ